MESFKVYSTAGEVLGTCSFVIGLTREKKSNNYVLMMREVMTPNNSKVLIEHVMNKEISYDRCGYGFSEYVSVKVALPSLDDYEPHNTPKSDEITFSIGGNKDGVDVGASYTVTHEDLDITASCNTPSKTYYVKYNYKPSLLNPFASNKYVANESVQLGVASFHTKEKMYSLKWNMMQDLVGLQIMQLLH